MLKLNCRAIIFKRALCALAIIGALISSIFAGFNIIYIKTYVKGQSMSPTLNVNVPEGARGDTVYINRFASLKRNDIVVLKVSDSDDEYIIKRLVALAGDVVNIEQDEQGQKYNLVVNDEVLYSRPYYENGKKIEYGTVDFFNNYIEEHKNDEGRILKGENGEMRGVIIKPGEAYLLGDNWSVSRDSSLLGPYKYKNIVGRVDFIVKRNQNDLINILNKIF